MMIQITPFNQGPLENNAYLLIDPESHEAIVVDPSFDSEQLNEEINREHLHINQILITHAHFDHIAGVNQVMRSFHPHPAIGLHVKDLPLWNMQGQASKYGFNVDPLPKPDILLNHGDTLYLGKTAIDVIHTPGHTPGHVVFSIREQQSIFCGDLIFAGSIGRTDLEGGDYRVLMDSIHNQIMVFPDDTKLFPGHGPQTTVSDERRYNPYLNI